MSPSELQSVIAMRAMKALYDRMEGDEACKDLMPSAKEALLAITKAAEKDLQAYVDEITKDLNKYVVGYSAHHNQSTWSPRTTYEREEAELQARMALGGKE